MDTDWTSLPIELLEIISEKMETLRDYLYFGIVCTSWNLATKGNQRKNIVRTLPQVPILLVPSDDDNDHSHAMYNVLTESFLESKLTVPINKRFIGSSLGWLVTLESNFSIKLHKACPRIIINEGDQKNGTDSVFHLPPLFPDIGSVQLENSCVHKVVITADPLTNPDQCVVMVIFTDTLQVAFIRPNDRETTSWTRGDGDTLLHFNDLLYHNDKFYGLTTEGCLKSFRILDQSVLDVELVANEIPFDIVGKNYLVELRGEIFQVVRYLDWKLASDLDETISYEDNYVVGRNTMEVLVFELDYDGKSWVMVENLGDCSLFLGDNSSISVLSSKFTGCRSNCVYFTHDHDALQSCNEIVCDLGFYDIEKNKMELNFGSETTSVVKHSKRVPIWVVPYAQ